MGENDCSKQNWTYAFYNSTMPLYVWRATTHMLSLDNKQHKYVYVDIGGAINEDVLKRGFQRHITIQRSFCAYVFNVFSIRSWQSVIAA